jgi:hypothetical protein
LFNDSANETQKINPRMMNQNALIMPTDYQVELGSRPLSDSEYSECSESSIESHLSRASNWTKGKSR